MGQTKMSTRLQSLDARSLEQRRVLENRSRLTALVVSAGIGALLGATAGYIYIQSAERKGKKPELTAMKGVQIGVMAIGLLRSVAGLID
jgi:uncharacterized membrane protein YidH (DUF202 family)